MPDPIKRPAERVPTSPELRPEPEAVVERVPVTPEASPAAPSERVEQAPTTVVITAPATAAPAPVKDPLTKKIDTILEEDLAEVYFKMTPAEQAAFKTKGEETTSKIKVLLGKTTVVAKDILKLIVEWLRLIPGVNKYFLEQEAKIKTDKILQIKK